MNYDEFAFFNHQLSAMLRDGIPLEGALKQLVAGMKDKALQGELESLQADLARGTTLQEALSRRSLPELYRRMVQIGSRSNDVPGVLTLLADHYQATNAIWTRLKGLMVYPFLVIGVSLGLTLVLCVVFNKFTLELFSNVHPVQPGLLMLVWFPPVLLALVAAAMVFAVTVPSIRNRLRWRLPGFRDASAAQLASALALMVRNGLPLSDALALAETLEAGTPAEAALARWRGLVESGVGKPGDWTEAPGPLPPLFLWLVQQSGEKPAEGLQKAAEIYRGRAAYRVELALYGALPISILLLGQMVLWQVAPMVQTLTSFMNMLGDASAM